MSDDLPSLDAARQQSIAARAEFQAALHEATGWFSPTRLKAEAAQAAGEQIGEAKAALRRSASQHPILAWSGLAFVATGLTYVLRRPVIALARAGAGAINGLRKRFSRRNG